MNKWGNGQFCGFSAGSHPSGKVNPLALELLEQADFETAGLHSKSWDEFAAPKEIQFDFFITVCDNAAGEVWPGKPLPAHWGIPDPAAVQGTAIGKTPVSAE